MPSCQVRAAAKRIKTVEETIVLAIAQAAAWIVNSSGNLEKGKVIGAYDIIPQIKPNNYDELVKKSKEYRLKEQEEIVEKIKSGEVKSSDLNAPNLPVRF